MNKQSLEPSSKTKELRSIRVSSEPLLLTRSLVFTTKKMELISFFSFIFKLVIPLRFK